MGSSDLLDKTRKTIFFAYQGRGKGLSDDNVDSIKKAIESYNTYQGTYLAVSWENYRGSSAISKDVMTAIDSCEAFVCDLTYYNHNVLFELGYAIARNKKILILLNEAVEAPYGLGNASQIYKNFLLKDIRYTPIVNFNCIRKALQNHDFKKDLISQFVNVEGMVRNSNDIFYIQSKIPNQASLELSQHILGFKDSRGLSLISDDTSEVKYRTLTWYFQSILKSKVALIHLLGEQISNSFLENATNSFYAGVAAGNDCSLLLVAPAKYKAPLDYHDILIQYPDADELCLTTLDWLETHFKPLPKKEVDHSELEHELSLIKLGIGCEAAENEKMDLLKYFTPTASYYSALKQEKSILVGRKGSGKTAIYIKLATDLPHEAANYVISLQPESEELLDDVNLGQLYSGSRSSFFAAVWKLVIFSKLAQSVFDKLQVKSMTNELSFHEKCLSEFVEANKDFIRLNFFGVVKEISYKFNNKLTVDDPDVLQLLFKSYLSPLIKCLRDYFLSIKEKYYSLVILADNLDKTWDAKNDLSLQTDMILTLIDIENKIKNELKIGSASNISLKNIIFLRQDIYDYVRSRSIEPDKLTTMAHVIDWENYSALLREMLENRFVHILNIDKTAVEEKAWKAFFSFKGKKHPYDLISEIITKRPRDLIYFVGRLFESAINKDHKKVNDEDLQYAILSYTEFLNNNLIAETRAEFPDIAEVLSQLQGYNGEMIEYSKLDKILDACKYDKKRKKNLVETLFKKQYMLGFDTKTNEPFDDLEVLERKLKEKKWFFLRNKVFVIAHAKYYFIKNKISSPF